VLIVNRISDRHYWRLIISWTIHCASRCGFTQSSLAGTVPTMAIIQTVRGIFAASCLTCSIVVTATVVTIGDCFAGFTGTVVIAGRRVRTIVRTVGVVLARVTHIVIVTSRGWTVYCTSCSILAQTGLTITIRAMAIIQTVVGIFATRCLADAI
jgi:hypothetical protein